MYQRYAFPLNLFNENWVKSVSWRYLCLMKVQLFEPFRIKFAQANRSRNPEFGLLNTIMEFYPESLLKVFRSCCKKYDGL